MNTNIQTSSPMRIFPVLVLFIAVIFIGGGIRLLSLGGSLYYLLAGIALGVSAIQMWRSQPNGAWVYGGVLLLTLVWGLYEVGLDFWALQSRLFLFLVM